jgi:cyclohexa-1,5-dienecarbonyl-CoA hydratase
VSAVTEHAPVSARLEQEGTLLLLELARPKANILDMPMLAALREQVAGLASQPQVKTVLFAGQGKHFSFGASVEEHAPDQVGEMLPAFHALFHDLLGCGRVLLSAVRGQCLGGGLELAAFCQRVFAAPGAMLGQPEIKLGVIAPVASLILPVRMGQAAADDLLLSGRSVPAEEALQLGLVDELTEDPVEAALAWHAEHLQPLSAAGLRHAVQAARWGMHRHVKQGLQELERAYLDELMNTADAKEGIAAFLEKREPRWTHS